MVTPQTTPTDDGASPPPPTTSLLGRRRVQRKLLRLYNWGVWALLVILVCAQYFAILYRSVTDVERRTYGQSPELGKTIIAGDNDSPYTDRAIICGVQGHIFAPMQLSTALAHGVMANKSVFASNGIDGYRVMERSSRYELDADGLKAYTQQCTTIVETIDQIFDACDKLGYNVTRDVLRVIVDGNDHITILHHALPVLFFPYWDQANIGRYLVPGVDGSACLFRGTGTFDSSKADYAYLSATSRIDREAMTIKLLQYPGGVWRNGWYEDPVAHENWYSDVFTSDRTLSQTNEFPMHQFDLLNGSNGVDCTAQETHGCNWGDVAIMWGERLKLVLSTDWYVSIVVSTKNRVGVFLYDSINVREIFTTYSIEKLISSLTLTTLVVQWMAAMVALGESGETIGIGALANSKTFKFLPLLLLPRLRSTLEAFWSAGCFFESEQMVLTESWFIIYPAIGEYVLISFSLLNLCAKLCRRRMTDVGFGPTLILLALLHYNRRALAQSHLIGTGGRVVGAIISTEIAEASIWRFFLSYDFVFRINGKVKALFVIKTSVLAMNILPIFVGSHDMRRHCTMAAECEAETALALRLATNGGLGQSSIYAPHSTTNKPILTSYEVVRAGYVMLELTDVFTTRTQSRRISSTPTLRIDQDTRYSRKQTTSMVCISVNDWGWYLLASTLSFAGAIGRSMLMIRVLLYEAQRVENRDGTLIRLNAMPRFCRLDDSVFRRVRAWRIFARPVT